MAFDTPQSTNEAILQNMLGASNTLKPPQSRVEKLLQELSGQMPEANPSEGTTTGTLERLKIGDNIYSVKGGGSGTSDYDALNNKPQIAGTTLSGNKSLADLGIASASAVSDILDGTDIDSFGDVETALAGKQGTLTFDSAPTSESTNPVTSGGVYTALAGKVDKTSVGVASGVAELDSNGKVPSAQLPSYVDDVVNGYLHDGKFYADDQYTTEITGEEGKIYVDLATNKTYRWSGLAFVEISESLALGETSSTAYAGDKGKANADAISDIKDGQTIDSFADVESALAGKQGTLTFDNVPTENSTNPVKSGGIYSTLAGKADTGIVADDFDSTASYVIGNYCIENGKLYRFKANHSGTWSSANVDEIQITGELATLKSGLTNVDVALNVPTNSGKNLVDDTTFDSYTSDKGITVTPDELSKAYGTEDPVSGTNSGTGATGVLLMKSGYDIQLKGGVTYRFSGNWNGVTPGSTTIRADLRPYNTLDVLASETAEGVGTYTPTNDIRVRVFVRVAGSYAIPNDVKAYPVLTELQNTSYVPYIPSVESRIEAVEERKIKWFAIEVPANATEYDYSSDAPAGAEIICVLPTGGAGLTVVQCHLGQKKIYFASAPTSKAYARVFYY